MSQSNIDTQLHKRKSPDHTGTGERYNQSNPTVLQQSTINTADNTNKRNKYEHVINDGFAVPSPQIHRTVDRINSQPNNSNESMNNLITISNKILSDVTNSRIELNTQLHSDLILTLYSIQREVSIDPHSVLGKAIADLVLRYSDMSSQCVEQNNEDTIHCDNANTNIIWCILCIFIVCNYQIYCNEYHTTDTIQTVVLTTPSITQLLTVAQVKLSDFIIHLHHAITKHFIHELPQPYITQLRLVQSHLLSSIKLYEKFELLFHQHIQPLYITDHTSHTQATTQLLSALRGFTWLLYLCANHELNNKLNQLSHNITNTDIYTMYTLLLCVIRYIIVTSNGVDSIESFDAVCTHDSQVDANLFNTVQSTYNDIFLFTLNTLQSSNVLNLTNVITINLNNNIKSLSQYIDTYASNIDSIDIGYWVDQRIFLPSNNTHTTHTQHPILSAPLTSVADNTDETPTNDAMTSNTQYDTATNRCIRRLYTHSNTANDTPVRSQPTELDIALSPVLRTATYPALTKHNQTPISKLLTGVNWLVDITNSVELHLNDHIIQYYNAVKQDSYHSVNKFITQQINNIQLHTGIQSDNINFNMNMNCIVQSRRQQIHKLYNYIIQSTVLSEHSKQQSNQSTGTDTPTFVWLTSKSFNMSVLAWSILIVTHIYSINHITMESIVTLYSMKYWDVCKAADSVVQTLLLCPTQVKQYITTQLHVLLLQYTWLHSDTLYTLLHNKILHSDVMKLLQSSNAAQHMQSITIPSTPSTLQRSTTSYDTQHTIDCNTMLLYYRKLITLIADRLNQLCSKLNITSHQSDTCFHLIYYVTTQCHELCYNRHIDSIILCSMYSVVVAMNTHTPSKPHKLSFKSLIHVYTQLYGEFTHINLVIHNVPCNDTAGATTTIIKYYNEYYVPAVKSYALDVIKPMLNHTNITDTTSTKHQLYHSIHSPLKLSNGTVIIMSPSRIHSSSMLYKSNSSPAAILHSVSQQSLTPRSKQLYCFGSISSTMKLSQNNELFNKLHGARPQSSRVLSYTAPINQRNNAHHKIVDDHIPVSSQSSSEQTESDMEDEITEDDIESNYS